ncbi:MAG: hypothetical protein M1550_05845 [Deltaproteobacteria bacterium]|nr:hypothetical protein [Deltaproteobacteria bacterium]
MVMMALADLPLRAGPLLSGFVDLDNLPAPVASPEAIHDLLLVVCLLGILLALLLDLFGSEPSSSRR